VTGKQGSTTYTTIVAEDDGGGSLVIPGPNGSDTAPMDFGSFVAIARVRKDLGRSFVSALVTDRENDGGSYNRVFGPDFEWHPNNDDTLTGEWLQSRTLTPNRPDLSSGWTGEQLDSHAAVARFSHNTTHFDAFGSYNDVGSGFRADLGFVPQVGYRETYGETGWTVRPAHGFISRVRTFLIADRQVESSGPLISRALSPGAGMDTKLNGFMRFRYEDDVVRSGTQLFPRHQFVYVVQISPSRAISQLSADGYIGTDVDFENSRPATGGTINFSATLHPTDHLELALVESDRILHVDDAFGIARRLFDARVSRVKGTYNFTARCFVRVIAQSVATHRDTSLYVSPIAATDGGFNGSGLFAYKLNWQSVLFVGYGDDRALSDTNQLERSDRQFFVKVSYAFQR
jgi:hypothetical protein